ncbi:four helix bundle protein [Patescibacteria group bacterium]|nr:four helix bundle protein [Candidatus Falkowbacteria bacterium]MBU3905669.1 four helix bundle protein [Patescibacteria group bacterium]MCG2698689.1 four helix bundle protein [Candidatus Parcubacteria bacterium]MBU4014755.1 four helix bundle protein [Patescibacteria group bacterium]MBU4026515.1 four helix bundle protein [Patescibacteria group bacterium]
MTKIQNKIYDLEDRTREFAINVRKFLKKLPKTISNIEDGKQVVRSSGSVGANYIEANEALSKKDFKMRIKISRKEAKESSYWLKIIVVNNDVRFEAEGRALIQEAEELKKIFCSILEKSK